jgi:hypothetical protein
VGGDHDRRRPRESRLGVPVEVDDIRCHARRDVEQPAARGIEPLPRIFHPFQRDVEHDRLDDRCRRELRALAGRGRWTHDDEHHVDAMPGKPDGKVERVRPHPADGVGRHQHRGHRP